MFGDLRRFDTGRTQGLDWFRQLMDEMLPEAGTERISAAASR